MDHIRSGKGLKAKKLNRYPPGKRGMNKVGRQVWVWGGVGQKDGGETKMTNGGRMCFDTDM